MVRDRPRPSFFRRMERHLVGAVMTVMAFVLERIVIRSIKKDGGEAPAKKSTSLRTQGAEVDLDQ
jgi:hypothetical protein